MQATTSETFVAGIILEQAIFEFLEKGGLLSKQDVRSLGFSSGTLKERLLCFGQVQKACAKSVNELSKLTEEEARTYARNGRSVYWSDSAMVTVFRTPS